MVSVTNPKPTNPTVLKADGSGNDIQQWQLSDGTNRTVINQTGEITTAYSIFGATYQGRYLYSRYNTNSYPFIDTQHALGTIGIVARANTHIPLTIKGAASQTADLQQWQDSAGNIKAYLASNGQLSVDLATTTVAHLVRLNGVSKVGLDTRGIRYLDAANEQTTIGAAGTASALPSAPTKYLRVVDSAGNILAIPAYASA